MHQAVSAVVRLDAPRRAADDDERPLGAGEHRPAPARRRAGSGWTRMTVAGLRVGGVGLLDEHVLGQREHDRARAAGGGDVEGARDELGDPVGIVDLLDPLRHRAEHVAVVDLLERLPPHHVAADLADQEDQRRRVLEGGVDAAGGVRRAGAAGDHADARPAGELAVGVGHVRGADLVAAGDEADRRVVERVEHGQVALAGHAEGDVHPVDDELVDEEPAARPHVRVEPVLEEDGGLLELRPILVGGVDVADRALPGPLGGQDQDADERRRLVLRRLGEHRIGAGLEPGTARPVRGRCAPRCGCRSCRGAGSGSPARDGCGCRRRRRAGSRCGRSA